MHTQRDELVPENERVGFLKTSNAINCIESHWVIAPAIVSSGCIVGTKVHGQNIVKIDNVGGISLQLALVQRLSLSLGVQIHRADDTRNQISSLLIPDLVVVGIWEHCCRLIDVVAVSLRSLGIHPVCVNKGIELGEAQGGWSTETG